MSAFASFVHGDEKQPGSPFAFSHCEERADIAVAPGTRAR